MAYPQPHALIIAMLEKSIKKVNFAVFKKSKCHHLKEIKHVKSLNDQVFMYLFKIITKIALHNCKKGFISMMLLFEKIGSACTVLNSPCWNLHIAVNKNGLCFTVHASQTN